MMAATRRRFIKDHVDIEEVRAMLDKGKTWVAIAMHYEFEPDPIRKYCHKHGLYVSGPYKKGCQS